MIKIKLYKNNFYLIKNIINLTLGTQLTNITQYILKLDYFYPMKFTYSLSQVPLI